LGRCSRGESEESEGDSVGWLGLSIAIEIEIAWVLGGCELWPGGLCF
jgi:hypothetical protein